MSWSQKKQEMIKFHENIKKMEREFELWNISVSLRSIPDACKIAKIKPLFKKGSKTDP